MTTSTPPESTEGDSTATDDSSKGSEAVPARETRGQEGHSLSILGVTYLVREYRGQWWKGCCFRQQTEKAVLRNVSMFLQTGEVTAVMGSSGSGKTSLLDVVSSRTNGQVIGGIYLDNKLMTEELFQKEGGYVLQDDHLLPNLTVRETLHYTATLKFASSMQVTASMDDDLIKLRVDEVVSEMGLRQVADTCIGGTIIRGISGGERRRVSIAVQLLQDPKILLLDEPTSGLDSFTAHYLVQGLSEMAKKGNKIVLMTIHQPRSDIFRLFDHVTILSMGEAVYTGPANQMVRYFTEKGHPCPTYANPLDHYIDLASVDRRDQDLQDLTEQQVVHLKVAYVHSDIFRNTLADIHNSTRVMESTVDTYSLRPWHSIANPPGFWFAFVTILSRLMVNLYRDRSAFVFRLFQLSVFAFFLWIFLWTLQNNQESIQDRIGLFYQSVQVPPYVGLLNCVALFPPLRELYYREARDGLYNFLVFLLAYFVQILPFHICSSFVFSTWVYWAIGLYPEASRYGIYWAVILIMHYVGEILGVVFMGIFNNPAVTNSSVALILAIAGLISSGFLRSTQNMLDIFHYISYVNIFKYASEILVANEFHGLELTCANDSNVPCMFESGDDYLAVFYPDAVENMPTNFAACSIFVCLFILCSFFTFKVKGIYNLR